MGFARRKWKFWGGMRAVVERGAVKERKTDFWHSLLKHKNYKKSASPDRFIKPNLHAHTHTRTHTTTAHNQHWIGSLYKHTQYLDAYSQPPLSNSANCSPQLPEIINHNNIFHREIHKLHPEARRDHSPQHSRWVCRTCRSAIWPTLPDCTESSPTHTHSFCALNTPDPWWNSPHRKSPPPLHKERQKERKQRIWEYWQIDCWLWVENEQTWGKGGGRGWVKGEGVCVCVWERERERERCISTCTETVMHLLYLSLCSPPTQP